MTPEQFHQNIDRLIALSQTMLRCANEQRWEELETRHAERENLLKQTFPGNIPGEFATLAGDCIARIRQIDSEIKSLVEVSHADSATQLKNLNKGSKAAKIYQQHQ